MPPLPVYDELVFVPPLGEGQQDRVIPIAILQLIPVHFFLLLPLGPVADDGHLVRAVVALGAPVEIDCLGGAAANATVPTFKTLVLLYHSKFYKSAPPSLIMQCQCSGKWEGARAGRVGGECGGGLFVERFK